MEKYQLTIDQLDPNELSDSSPNEIYNLRRLIQESSKINFAAIDDLEREGKEVQELNAQLQDLEEAALEIQETIKELDQKSRDQFKATFDEVASHFSEHFQTLFLGGLARLTLVDSDDLLTAGIEIEVEPPGKKLRSLQLLSGGERCLTSIALLLALFRVTPAPLCLLDEIDAPLDETNVKRFLEMIKPFSEKTQLVVITHNKQTMSRADILLGVSMEEQGVSKLLSLSFSQEKVLIGA
jgi:chromosome segregation protein